MVGGLGGGRDVVCHSQKGKRGSTMIGRITVTIGWAKEEWVIRTKLQKSTVFLKKKGNGTSHATSLEPMRR